MSKLKLSLVGAIVIAGVAASLTLQNKARVKLMEKEQALLAQNQQLAELNAEHQRLSNQVVAAKSPIGDDRTAELNKLHREAEELRKQTNALRNQLERKTQPTTPQSNSKAVTHPPEYYEQMRVLAGAKPADGHYIAAAMAMYASDHDQFPTNMDQVASYLAKEKMQISGTNAFDIVYQGSFDRLKSIPIGSVAVIRSREAFLTPDGKLARVYGLADGSSQMVASDDNFKAWEAEHILPPPTPGQ